MVERSGQRLGNYRLVKRLGNGGFAEVYRGEHIYLKHEVAIKIMYARGDEVDVEAFSQEGRVLVKLMHPHIIRVLDFGIEDGTAFLVMDYAPNGTLRQQYPPGSRMPLALVVKYVQQVASALQYAHNQKLIHRDVKPENVLLDRNSDALLTDFGVAIITQSTYDSRLQQQEAAGTIAYMAPESVQAQPRAASDQYALAIVAYEWLCGTRPFTGSFMEVAAKHALTEPPSLREYVPDLPLAVERVILTALAKAPEDRFASVQEFADALEKAALDREEDTLTLPVVRQKREQKITPMPASLRQESLHQAFSPAALVTPPAPLPAVQVREVETQPPGPAFSPRRNRSMRRRWLLLFALFILLLLFSSIGVATMLSNRGDLSGSGGLATATSASIASPQVTPTAGSSPTSGPTPSPEITATLPPVDALPAVGGNYNGPIHNSPADVDSSMTLRITQSQTDISGQFTVNPPLSGNGPFTGKVSAGNQIRFTVHSPDIKAPLLFTGAIAPDHSMSGSYCSLNAQGKCDKNVGGYGTWHVAKS